MSERELCTALDDTVRTVPIREWGRDHASTLLYVEARCVDHRGVLKNENMSCNARRHRKLLVGAMSAGTIAPRRWKDEYSTRLREDQESGHDDWDCLEEMAGAGLLTFAIKDKKPGFPFEGGEVVVKLTREGADLAALLRRCRQLDLKDSSDAFDEWIVTREPAK